MFKTLISVSKIAASARLSICRAGQRTPVPFDRPLSVACRSDRSGAVECADHCRRMARANDLLADKF